MIIQNETPRDKAGSRAEGSLGCPIIILGMSRSGTSLVADLVHRWGAYGGDRESLTRGNAGNPRGYFEYRPMQHFLVTQLGLDFWSPGYVERLRERSRDSLCRQKALGLIAGMTAESPVWFWKEPSLSFMLPFWKEIWGEAVYIIPLRDPYDCAVSYQKFSIPPEVRDKVSIICATLLEWQYSMLCILEELQEVPQKIFVPYEALVASPEEECRRLCAFLDNHRGRAGFASNHLERMVEAIDPHLHRNSGEVDFSSRLDVTPAQKALNRFLLAKVGGLSLPFDPVDYPLYEGWREYLANIFFFRQFTRQVVPLMSSRWFAMGVALNRGFSRLAGVWRRGKR